MAADQVQSKMNSILALLDTLTEQMIPALESEISGKVDPEQLEQLVVELVRRESAGSKPLIIEDHRMNPMQLRQVDGLRHKQFDEVLNDLLDGDDLYLWGASGAGKSHLAWQISKVLNNAFYCVQLCGQSSPSALFGYNDAMGVYQETDYYRAYTKGGIFVAEEYDIWNESIKTMNNTALSQGFCSFPNGMHDRHPDFHWIANGNTPMLGANEMYTSRSKADAANRERFTFVHFEYDEVLERRAALVENPHADPWVDWVQLARRIVGRLNLKLVVSPRASIKGARKLRSGHFSPMQIADKVLFKGIDADTRSKVLVSAPVPAIDMKYCGTQRTMPEAAISA